MNFFYVYGLISYPLFLYLGIFLTGKRLNKRKHALVYIIVLSLIFIVCDFFIYYGLVDCLASKWDNIYLFTLFRVLSSTINFLLAFVLLVVCFKSTLSQYTYCLVCAICLQHCSQQISNAIYKIISFDSQILDFVINLALYAIVYSIYLIYLRKVGKQAIRIDEKRQFILASLVVMVAIYAMPFATAIPSNKITMILFSLLSAIIAFLGLLLENQLIQYKSAQLENAANKKLIEEQKKQYQLDKDIIDKLNIKAHDLHHQLEDGLPLEKEYGNSLLSIVKAYDSIFHTGNEALDIVLSKISLRCQKQNINLTCMADGELLSFLKNEEIYSLFGNILDNAYESAILLENENQRLISLIVFKEKGVITIKETNYYSGPDDFDSHKADRFNHGFGLLSIKQIVEQYGGKISLSKKDGIFTLKICFFR